MIALNILATTAAVYWWATTSAGVIVEWDREEDFSGGQCLFWVGLNTAGLAIVLKAIWS